MGASSDQRSSADVRAKASPVPRARGRQMLVGLSAAVLLLSAGLSVPAAAAGTDPTRTPASPTYTVSLTSDATGGTWTGHQSVTFRNSSATPLTEVYLRLWDNFYGSCLAPPVTITNVTGGTAGVLQVGCTALQIRLPAPLSQGATGTIGFDLLIKVPADRFGREGAYAVFGNALPVLAVRDGRGWHLDPYTNNGESFYALISDYHVTLDHPTSILVPATGTSTDTAGAAGRTVTHAVGRNVREFAWAAGPFEKVSGATSAGIAINVYRVSTIGLDDARSVLALATTVLDAHAARFGAYPYGEIDVVLDNAFWFGGMEYPGLVLDQVDLDPNNPVVLPHELAHQWWYGIVGDDEYTTPWLDEGFATYATDLYRNDTRMGCSIVWQSPDEKLTNSMAYWDQHPQRYPDVVYDYGACTLHDLGRLIGDPAMANLLKSYAASHWYGVSTVADFKAAAQAAAGSTDLTAFWAAHRVEG